MVDSIRYSLCAVNVSYLGFISFLGLLLQLAGLIIISLNASTLALARDDDTYFSEAYYQYKIDGNYLEIYKKYISQLQLLSFYEISLTDENVEAYRFMLKPAFSSTIIIQVIKRSGNAVIAEAFEVGCDNSTLGRTVPFRLKDGHIRMLIKDKKFDKFVNILNEGLFWELYHFGWGGGLDTAVWVIEGVKNGQHHFFSSSDPIPSKIEKAVRYMHENVMGISVER